MKDKDYNNAKEIKIEVNGKEYSGRYVVRGKILTLLSVYGQQSTQLGGMTPPALARLLLSELVRHNHNKEL